MSVCVCLWGCILHNLVLHNQGGGGHTGMDQVFIFARGKLSGILCMPECYPRKKNFILAPASTKSPKHLIWCVSFIPILENEIT